jgi:protein SCO1/2
MVGPDGDWTGDLRHVLKVFLVDGRGRIRNIYSTGFLDIRILENDAVTLLAEAEIPQRPDPGSSR